MNSFLSYMGGKSLLANKIIPRLPEHHCYCEVFAGAAWMLFKKEESEVEIINDINTELVTLYRVVKLHLEEFVRYFKWALVVRDEFKRLIDENPETLTDIQRASRFYYLLRNSFASKIPNPTFNIAPSRPPNFNLLRIEEELSAAHLRLSRVYVENLPYEKLIPRFDRPDTFFYLDPPYYGCEDCYGKNIFQREDFEKLRVILSEISGKFILSINDTPEIRDVYKNFKISEVSTTYNCTVKKRPKVVELLVSNF